MIWFSVCQMEQLLLKLIDKRLHVWDILGILLAWVIHVGLPMLTMVVAISH